MKFTKGPSTRTVYINESIEPGTGSIVPPVYENVAYAFNNLESWRAVALGESDGYIYL